MFNSFHIKYSVVCIFILFQSVVAANTLESLVMPGEVIDGHKKYEAECSNCHEIFSKKGQDYLCLDCHKKVNDDIKKKRGFHGRNKAIRASSCKTCHTEHKGRKADIVKLNASTFNHNQTDFILKGRHKVIECDACHKKNKKHREVKSQCQSCHLKESPHKKAKAKKGSFDRCHVCHSAKGWNIITFDHDKNTKYKLTGTHATAPCESCHINQQYKKTEKLCIACHKIDDVHRGENGDKCGKCHSTKKWGKISFDHTKDTTFPLKEKHKETPCKSCHKKRMLKDKKANKKKEARKCYSCHSYDDNHNGVFGEKCNDCHVVKGWDKPKFNHDKDTKFKLKDKHKKLGCNSCHKKKVDRSIVQKKIISYCINCHKKDDVHKGSLGKKCDSCHTSSSWKKRVNFEHDMTDFPLLGMHSSVACEECHSNAQHKDMEKSCVTCHNNDDFHKGTLGNNCERCHTPNDWRVWLFNHEKQSKFKITGAHKKVHCHSCHNEVVDKIPRIPRDCQDCHANVDPHNGQFGSQCNDCHNTKDFKQINMK